MRCFISMAYHVKMVQSKKKWRKHPPHPLFIVQRLPSAIEPPAHLQGAHHIKALGRPARGTSSGWRNLKTAELRFELRVYIIVGTVPLAWEGTIRHIHNPILTNGWQPSVPPSWCDTCTCCPSASGGASALQHCLRLFAVNLGGFRGEFSV